MLDPRVQRLIQGTAALLAEDRRPPNAKKLKGRDAFRVWTGEYRVIYRIEDDSLPIVVVTLGHRRDVYERQALTGRARGGSPVPPDVQASIRAVIPNQGQGILWTR